jgi:hypothetical protein
MSRSLIRQLEQIRRAEVYDDAVVDFNTSAVAEPVISGSLEEDMNVLRSIVKQVKGGTNWFDNPGMYFDPTNTTSGNVATKQLNLANISGNTLDSKTVIIAATNDNAGAGYTVSGTSTGVLIVPFDTRYADPVNRVGLPIFKSVANAGTYYDEGGFDTACRVDVVNKATGVEMTKTTGGYTIYAKLHDGADHSGVGEGTDVYVKFYANGVETDLSGLDGGAPTEVVFVHPFRRRMSDMLEYEWMRTDFVSSWQGDIVLIDDISNLWSYTGATNDATDPSPWTNETASYVLSSSPNSLRSAIDIINTEVGNRIYTGAILTDGDPISASIEDLNAALITAQGAISGLDTRLGTAEGEIDTLQGTVGGLVTDVSTLQGEMLTVQGDISDIYVELNTISGTMIGDLIFTNNDFFNDGDSITTILESVADALTTISGALDVAAPEKYVESVGTTILKNTSYATPAAYTPVSTSGREGMNMDVYIDGQLLAADTGADGVNADRDYAETDSTHITFRFNIQAGRNITYVIRQ